MRKWTIKILVSVMAIMMMASPNCVIAQNTAQELYEQAQSAASQGDSAKAIDLYERSIDADPDFALAYSALGSYYLENNGKVEDVVWLFQQAAELEPQNAEHYTSMCRAYFQSQQHDWAESACLKALSIDPNSGSAQLSLAWIYLLGKIQPADAVKYFNEVIKKIPNNPKIYYGLGMAYARNNEQAKALDVITNLRSMGHESLATQLEKMIRPSADMMMPPPEMGPAVRPSMPDAGPSKVVKAKPEEPAPLPARDPNAPPPGKIRIQLKARLPTEGETDPATSSKNQKKKEDDDDYDVEDYKPLTLRERQERVKRMRGSTGSASGSGTVTTQTTGTP